MIHSPPCSGRTLDVTILVTEGTLASTTFSAIEIFYSAGRLWNALNGVCLDPCFRIRVASVDGRVVNSWPSMTLTPACAIDDVEDTDIIIVSASGADVRERLANDAAVLPWLRQWFDRGAFVAGICGGAAYLAASGLLDGKRATTHRAIADDLANAYPAVLWEPDEFVTEDGRLLCSGGVHAAIDLSLHLVEKFCGRETAVQCARTLSLSVPHLRDGGGGLLRLSRPHSDQAIRKAEEYMQQHLAENLSIERIASSVCLSTRTFMRRFKSMTGRQPGAYLQALRVAAAKEMLERGTRSVAVVCTEAGYEDVSFFRAIFRRHTGMTPTEYRRTYGSLSRSSGELAGRLRRPGAQVGSRQAANPA